MREGCQGRGIGRDLYTALLKWTEEQNFKTAVAVISVLRDNSVSLVFHQKFGFEKAAHLREVGFKFGNWIDVVMMQKMF